MDGRKRPQALTLEQLSCAQGGEPSVIRTHRVLRDGQWVPSGMPESWGEQMYSFGGIKRTCVLDMAGDEGVSSSRGIVPPLETWEPFQACLRWSREKPL
jgi:hypothetical protein